MVLLPAAITHKLFASHFGSSPPTVDVLHGPRTAHSASCSQGTVLYSAPNRVVQLLSTASRQRVEVGTRSQPTLRENRRASRIATLICTDLPLNLVSPVVRFVDGPLEAAPSQLTRASIQFPLIIIESFRPKPTNGWPSCESSKNAAPPTPVSMFTRKATAPLAHIELSGMAIGLVSRYGQL